MDANGHEWDADEHTIVIPASAAQRLDHLTAIAWDYQSRGQVANHALTLALIDCIRSEFDMSVYHTPIRLEDYA